MCPVIFVLGALTETEKCTSQTYAEKAPIKP